MHIIRFPIILQIVHDIIHIFCTESRINMEIPEARPKKQVLLWKCKFFCVWVQLTILPLGIEHRSFFNFYYVNYSENNQE